MILKIAKRRRQRVGIVIVDWSCFTLRKCPFLLSLHFAGQLRRMSFAAVHRPTDRQTVAGNRHRLCVRECSLNFGSSRSGSDREDGSRAALAGREELGKASKGDKFICRQLDGHSSLQLLLSLSLSFSRRQYGR